MWTHFKSFNRHNNSYVANVGKDVQIINYADKVQIIVHTVKMTQTMKKSEKVVANVKHEILVVNVLLSNRFLKAINNHETLTRFPFQLYLCKM